MTKIAYFGPAATFTHEAACKKFGLDQEYLPLRLIPDIFFAVARGEADFGVIPVENTIEGAVTHTLDMFGRSGMEGVRICDEIYLPITQNLLTNPEGPQSLEEIKVVYSHPQALAQCRLWLQKHLPHAHIQESTSTAAAAQFVASAGRSAGRSDDRSALGAAAIANRLAAAHYGLRIFQESVEDADFNQTRFLVITRQDTPYSAVGQGREVTALMLSIKDRVGALHAVTSVMLKYDLNMNRIESRPSKQKAWDYVFFIDFFGHPSAPNVAAALAELQSETFWVRVLGAWTRETAALKVED